MPRYERFVNNKAKTLDGAINDSVTTITLNDTNGFPSEGDFRLIVGTEVMQVVSISAPNVTVVRGVDGTTSTSHSDGADVNIVISKAGLDAYFDHITIGASARPPCRLLNSSGGAVTASDFSFDNQGLAYVEDNPDGSITLGSDETASSGNPMHVCYKTAPTPPYTLTTAFQVAAPNWNGSGSSTVQGIAFRESSTGEFIHLVALPSLPLSFQIFNVFHWNSPTSFNTNVPGRLTPDFNFSWAFMQIEDDNTDLHFRASYDGIYWHDLATDGRTDFLASGPDQIAMVLSERGNGTSSNRNPKHEVTFKMWLEE